MGIEHLRAILTQRAEQDWDQDKYRVENDVDNFPENAAGWTGEQVGRVENFDDRVENRADNAVDDVEDLPENAARWTGEKVSFMHVPSVKTHTDFHCYAIGARGGGYPARYRQSVGQCCRRCGPFRRQNG